jgi:Tfp pilus assembly protein PilX
MRNLNNKQTGAALIIGLIFLVLLAIVGLSSMRSVTLQERTIGNSVDNYRAQHNADVALFTAEEQITTSNSDARTRFLNTVNDGVSHAVSTVWANCGVDTQNADNLCEVLSLIANAKYETTVDDDTYIVTVKAQGSANASVMLQSTFVGRIVEQR